MLRSKSAYNPDYDQNVNSDAENGAVVGMLVLTIVLLATVPEVAAVVDVAEADGFGAMFATASFEPYRAFLGVSTGGAGGLGVGALYSYVATEPMQKCQ